VFRSLWGLIHPTVVVPLSVGISQYQVRRKIKIGRVSIGRATHNTWSMTKKHDKEIDQIVEDLRDETRDSETTDKTNPATDTTTDHHTSSTSNSDNRNSSDGWLENIGASSNQKNESKNHPDSPWYYTIALIFSIIAGAIVFTVLLVPFSRAGTPGLLIAIGGGINALLFFFLVAVGEITI